MMNHAEASASSPCAKIWQAFEQRRYEQVATACHELIQSGDHLGEAYFLLGLVALARSRPDLAVVFLEKATSFSSNVNYLSQLARTYVALREDGKALQTAALAETLSPADAITLDTLGCVYSHCGDHQHALSLFERAVVATKKPHPEFLYNLATSLTFLGQFAEAERRYEQAIGLQPGFVKAHAAISKLRKQTTDSNHIARLRSLLVSAKDNDYLHLGYALAKEHEDCKDYSAVVDVLAAVNTRRKRELAYDISRDEHLFDALLDVHSGLHGLAANGEGHSAPIFVLGMPRTGTTLVDRILASHPDLESLGELQAMPLALKRLAKTRSPLVLDLATIEASRELDPGRLAQAYLDAVSLRRKTGKRFIDKLPLNFLYIGYILKAFPDARIVCLKRNPMDVVWSNYKQLFSISYPYYDYSYDVADAAKYYILFSSLMEGWRELYPNNILELHYEDLVASPEVEVRSLLSFCGLEWMDSCLNFHANRGAVSTPSMAQVRQPIYQSSVNRWRCYADFLAPAQELFTAAGVQWAPP